MTDLLTKLRDWGCDIDGAMSRFLDDEEFYASCLDQVVDDPAFEKLGSTLREEKVEQAFEQAHTLKGVIANMGLTPLYNVVVQIVEPLRNGSSEDLMPKYEELIKLNDHLKAMMKE